LRPAAPRYLAIGRIGRPHGVHGEVRLEVMTDFPERFAPGAKLLVGPEQESEPQSVEVMAVRPHKEWLLVRFDIAGERTAASLLTGQYVYIPAEEARALEPDSYYPHELLGLEVATDEGRPLGRVTSVLETGAADVLKVDSDEGEYLIPMIADVIADVDLDTGRLTITPLPGLLE